MNKDKNNSVRNINWFSDVGTIVSGVIGIIVSISADVPKIASIITHISVGILLGFVFRTIAVFFDNKRKNKHFPNSYPIIDKKIPHVINQKSQVQLINNIADDIDIDNIIASPLEYTHETLIGNNAPSFKPNAEYLEEIYSNEIDYIVAITAENPNLWLSPTLCFYMANCYAVSLLNHAKKNEDKIIFVDNFEEDTEYHNLKTTKQCKPILEKLQDEKRLEDFQFIRFLIFSETQEECLKDTVFPSLKASQDLFRIHSFFIRQDKIASRLEDKYQEYINSVNIIWDRFISNYRPTPKSKFKNVVDIRKGNVKENVQGNVIPEFLILFKKNEKIEIHTYINGEPHFIKLDNNNNLDKGIIAAAKKLIAFLAECRLKNQKCDWNPNEKTLNSSKSYIDWKEKEQNL